MKKQTILIIVFMLAMSAFLFIEAKQCFGQEITIYKSGYPQEYEMTSNDVEIELTDYELVKRTAVAPLAAWVFLILFIAG
jgi:hypothetical protein